VSMTWRAQSAKPYPAVDEAALLATSTFPIPPEELIALAKAGRPTCVQVHCEQTGRTRYQDAVSGQGGGGSVCVRVILYYTNKRSERGERLWGEEFLATNAGGDDPARLASSFQFVAPVVGPLSKDEFQAALASFSLEEGFPGRAWRATYTRHVIGRMSYPHP